MHPLIFLLAILAASPAVAQAPSPPAAPPGAATPQFNASDQVPETPGYEDAFALYEVTVGGKPRTQDEQLTRWLDELKGGRARAGVLAGTHLAYLALTPADCTSALDVLTRSDELGNDQAAWKLAQLAKNTSCGEPDLAAQERWLKKAVTLDYLVAAQELLALYSPTGARSDPVQRYTYARVAAGYWDSVYPKDTNSSGRIGFDAAALQEMEKDLSVADRKRAETEAAKVLAQMLKRHERFTPTRPQEFARGGQDAKSAKGWGYTAYTIDYHHECAWNLAANCRGAQRLAFVDLNNNEQEFMSCTAKVTSKDFVTREAESHSRDLLIGPKVTRRLIMVDVFEPLDKSAVAVTCKAVPKLAENSAAGKCRAKLQSAIDAQQFYPESAKRRGIEGDAVVRYWIPPGRDMPADAEIARSSGYPTLDDAALETIRSGKFKSECDYGLGSIKISFKLQE